MRARGRLRGAATEPNQSIGFRPNRGCGTELARELYSAASSIAGSLGRTVTISTREVREPGLRVETVEIKFPDRTLLITLGDRQGQGLNIAMADLPTNSCTLVFTRMTERNSDPLASYREHLVLARQKAQDAYDKALFALSGGALGLSLTFIDKVIGEGAPVWPRLLLGAWICWTASLMLVVASHLFSGRALTDAISALDQDREEPVPGGKNAVRTQACNLASGAFLVVGVAFMIAFVYGNLLR